ncbi:alpha/beta hydrolase [Bremerella sp. T1]|uniref:alpha/beta fold hydrolase n=1 Tax=Bremerella sp. TYQ1 TaxID=3119568 RepID=UPI001CCE4F95|nr:alpha/beta hydrolase [Bremerella volcania]UBM37478.1 alpha/beta hydrolase [Bremerella volcania]
MCVDVDAKTRLSVTYSFHPANGEESRHVVVIHHGILHSCEHFQKLIAAFNDRHISVVMVDQQSENSQDKNWITIGEYVLGLKAAIEQFQRDNPTYSIGIYVFHSMGANIGEVMQREFPELREPTVLIAPIPKILGALPIFVRFLFTRPISLAKAILNADLKSMASPPEQTRKVFFDDDTDDDIVNQAHSQLKQSSFVSYLQVTFRWILTGCIARRTLPHLLLIRSKTDYIFKPWEFWWTRWWFRKQLRGDVLIPGGHDCFIENAEPTADCIAEFFKHHKELKIHSAHQGIKGSSRASASSQASNKAD